MTTSEAVVESVTLVSRLKAAASRAFRVIIALGQADSENGAAMQDKFHAAVSDISEIRIEYISEERGTFYVDNGVLYISEVSVAQILYAATTEYEKRTSANDSVLSGSELPELLEKIFIDFLLHEIRHRTQGVGDFDVVQRLKAAAGRSAMAEIDTYADRDAAWAYAAIEAGWDNRRLFLEKFREALFFSGDYYFKAFPISASRHDKIERAIAVLLMAARLATVDLANPLVERADLPLDAALSVALSSERTSLAIYRGEPNKRLLGVANDADNISGLVSDINGGRFDDALGKSVVLMSNLNILR